MIEPLQGSELRVFRSLVMEWDRDTVDTIVVELSRSPVSREEVEKALRALADEGYVEPFGDGRWRATDQGRAIKDSLTGTRFKDGTPVVVEVEGRTVFAKFVRVGEPGEGRHDPKVGAVRDIAWVRYLEGDAKGTLGTHFYREIDLR